MDVGIRELKARLSHYLDRVARGEIIRVTDRGKPKALMVPFPPRDWRESPALRRGVSQGWIIPRRRVPDPAPPLRLHSKLSVTELLAEDRGE